MENESRGHLSLPVSGDQWIASTTYHFHQTCHDDQPDDDPGDPICSSLFDILVNNLKLFISTDLSPRLPELTRSPATASLSFNTWARGPISRYSLIASYSGYRLASDQKSSGVSTISPEPTLDADQKHPPRIPPIKFTSMRSLNNRPVILSAPFRLSCRCPVILSSLGKEDVRASDSCMVDSKIDSFVDWAIACAKDSLNRCEWDLKALVNTPYRSRLTVDSLNMSL